jgi:signal transduction histidine kinase/ActR/RegA family two-component response regulator
MLEGRSQPGRGYALAVCVTAVVLLGREAVAGFLGRSDPFLPFIGAVLIASWVGGLRPGLLATLLSAVATDYFFVPPFFSLQIAKFSHKGDLLLFIVLGVLISYLSEKRLRLVRQLREADRGKDEFLATLAHELRNPLAPIANSVEYLRLNPSSDPQRRKLSDVIKRQVDHMTRLVDDLLDISRITSDKLELRKESVILSQIIESAVETARPQIDAQAHGLSVWLPAEPIYLNADLVRLAQVFSNLLNNAAKFTPRGGCVELVAAREGAEVEVTVRDNGIGIEAGDLGRIFESFAQVSHVPRGTRTGIGIGLALARRLVSMHGGTITAGSAGPGLGSEFTVRLPVSATPQYSKAKSSSEKAAAVAMSCRILVADDNRDSVESLSVLLAASGCQVDTAYNGSEALESARNLRPDVALLDIDMPLLDGYEVARRIREQDSRMVLIALTGWSQQEDHNRSAEAGFDHHLTKPLDLAALRAILSNWKARETMPA